MDKDKMIVVTGGAGFIGSGVVRHLNNLGYTNLLIVDDLWDSEKWKNLVGKQYVDIVSRFKIFDVLDDCAADVGAYIHLGACSSTVEKNADYLLENNYRFSVLLAEYAFENHSRFIYASSAATYGDGENGFDDNHDTLESLYPLNMYGYSKHMFDLWLKKNDLLNEAVGLKYFNVFGPNEYHKGRMASAITHFLPSAKSGQAIKLFRSNHKDFSDGDQKRDFIYVKDAVRMTCAFLENDASGIFNIGMGKASSWNELATGVFKALDIPSKIEYIDMPEDLVGKYQNFTQAPMGKTRQALGEDASTASLEDSVKEYVTDYLLTGKTW